jgi:hypothetical protein
MSNRSRVSRSKIVLSIMLLAFATATVSVPLTAETSSKPRESATATEPLPITGNRDSKLSVAQLFDSLTIDVAIDAKQNQRYIKADDQFDSFVYSETIQNNTKVIQPASENIMGWWKGNKTLKEIYMMEKGYFEETDQFAPIFLIVDLTNNRATPVQIKNAYLDVSASATDLQPYLEIGSIDRIGCDVGSYNPEFPFTNYGWGTVRGANMIYSFGKASSAQFTASLGTFEYTVDVSVEEGLRTSSLNINRLKAGHFSCASKAVVKSCLATLRGSGIFGSLTDSVYLSDVTVFVDTTGRFDYEWLSIDGTSNKRSSPFVIDIPLLTSILEVLSAVPRNRLIVITNQSCFRWTRKTTGCHSTGGVN